MSELDAVGDEALGLGPIDYILIEFPGSRFNGQIAPALIDVVERGIIRVLELLVIRKDEDGSVEAIDVMEMDPDEIGPFGGLAGGTLGLLADEDVAAAGEALEPGTTAGLLVWENTWAAPFADAVRGSGGEVVASGRIPVQDLLEALDAADAAAG